MVHAWWLRILWQFALLSRGFSKSRSCSYDRPLATYSDSTAVPGASPPVADHIGDSQHLCRPCLACCSHQLTPNISCLTEGEPNQTGMAAAAALRSCRELICSALVLCCRHR